MTNPIPFVAAALAAASLAGPAAAQPTHSPWWVQAGPVHIGFSTSAQVKLGGGAVPGAGADASSNRTLAVEVGYDLTREAALRLTVGAPPTTRLTGTGALAGAGLLGRVRYGPAVLSATYAFSAPGGWRPYVGAGLNYTMVMASRDGSITQLDAPNRFGSVLQAGLSVPFGSGSGMSFFVDVKKILLKAKATGFVGPAPAAATVTLDPLLLHAGIGFRF